MSTEAKTYTPGPWVAKGMRVLKRAHRVSGNGAAMEYDQVIGQAMGSRPNAALMASAPELLELVQLFEKSVEYEIRRSDQEGDDEGANLKRFTLHRIQVALANAGAAT